MLKLFYFFLHKLIMSKGTDSGRERGDGGKREWARQSTRAALQQTQDILTGPLTGVRGAGRAAGRVVVGSVATNQGELALVTRHVRK